MMVEAAALRCVLQGVVVVACVPSDALHERGLGQKSKMLGIVWRDGNVKEMEVTLTQTEMAMVVVSTAGGKVWSDGEAENLLPRFLRL
uniref:Uncharacterized protein K0253H11.32 n=1 Tax=Oryza sativa subsp. indica TaxID=39946 RepID=C8TFM0_ORYSI|nr:hypothetical protein [Oryza sativa Indica Group]